MSRIFEWDLMAIADLMPTHIVNYLLANGIVYENEAIITALKTPAVETAARLSDRTLIMLDTLVWERGACRMLRESQCSKLAAAIVYAARFEEFSKKLCDSDNDEVLSKTALWPEELQQLTRCQVHEIEDIALVLIRLNSEQPQIVHPQQVPLPEDAVSSHNSASSEVDEHDSIFGGKLDLYNASLNRE